MKHTSANQGVGAGGINPNAKTGESTVAVTARYRVVDTLARIHGDKAQEYATRSRARAKADELNAEYGAHRYDVVRTTPITPASAVKIATPVAPAPEKRHPGNSRPRKGSDGRYCHECHGTGFDHSTAPLRDCKECDGTGDGRYLAAPACNVCEDGYKAIHNGICTNTACPFSVVGGAR